MRCSASCWPTPSCVIPLSKARDLSAACLATVRLLHLIPSVDPQGGGAIEGVRRIHDALAAMGHTGDLVSLDSPEAPCVGDYPGPVVATGPSVSSYGYNERLVPWLRAHAARL